MPRYIYDQCGRVEELWPSRKAMVLFRVHDSGPQQRALLWADKLICADGQPLPGDMSIETELSVGDRLRFECHIYNNENNVDNCQWYISRAVLDRVDLSQADTLSNCTGHVEELAKNLGFIDFKLSSHGAVQRAVFLSCDVHLFGRRVCRGESLLQLLEERMPVQLDVVAVRDGRLLGGAAWFAPLVWRGPKPSTTVRLHADLVPEQLMQWDAIDCRSAGDERAVAARTGIRLVDAVGLQLEAADTRMACIMAAAAADPPMERVGRVLSIVDECTGLMLWQSRSHKLETVVFHRSNTYLFHLNLTHYDMRKIFQKGDHLKFTADRSPEPERYQWLASRVWVEDGR